MSRSNRIYHFFISINFIVPFIYFLYTSILYNLMILLSFFHFIIDSSLNNPLFHRLPLIECIFIRGFFRIRSVCMKYFHFDGLNDVYFVQRPFLKRVHFSICHTNLCHSLAHFQTANASLRCLTTYLANGTQMLFEHTIFAKREEGKEKGRGGQKRFWFACSRLLL